MFVRLLQESYSILLKYHNTFLNKYKYKTSKKSKQILNFQKRVSSATEFQKKKIVAYIAQAFHDSKIIVENGIVTKIEFPCFARNGLNSSVFSFG